MTILVVSNWHEKPELLVEQVRNYNSAFDGDLLHYVNLNAELEESFWKDSASKSIDFSEFSNLSFLRPAVPTAWGRVAHAYLRAVLAAMKDGRKFDYIYFHTSADLLLKRGVNRHIRNHDIGLGEAWRAKAVFREVGGREAVEAASAKGFEEAIRADPILPQMLRGMEVGHLYKSRAEGSFFRAELFFEIMFPLLSFRSVTEMGSMEKAYPLEEYLFTTCVEFFCARHRVRRARHLVLTSRAPRELATPEDLEAVLADPGLFGLKRFSPALNDPLRVRARQLLA